MYRKKQYGFGIVGCGMISEFHAKAIRAMKDGRLECVVSRNSKNAERVAKQFHCTSYTELKKFLAHPNLDIVTICTPAAVHMEPTVAAARAGKHIICEKPLDVTLERIDRMIRECKKNRVMLSGVFPRRFIDATKEFKNALKDKRLGKIALADAYIKWYRTQDYYDNRPLRGTWRADGGGALLNQGIHTVDQLYYLMGDVKEVSAFAQSGRIHKRIEVEDNCVATLKFKNGALGVIEGSTSCFSNDGHSAQIQVCGSDGSIFLKDNSLAVWDFRNTRASDKKVMQRLGEKKGGAGAGAADPNAIDYRWHQWNFEDVTRALRTGKKPLVDGSQARKPVEIILAIYESALKGGKPVKLPLRRSPKCERFQ